MLHYVKKYRWLILKISATLLFLIFLLYNIKLQNIIYSLKNINLKIFFIAFLIWPIGDYFKIRKWVTLVRVHEPSFSFYDGVKSFYSGISMALITPFSVGELTRGRFVKSQFVNELTGKTVLDKFFDFLTVIVLSISGMLILIDRYWLLVPLFIIYLYIIIYLKTILKLFNKISIFNKPQLNILSKISNGFNDISNTLAIKNSIYSIVFFVIFYFQTYIVLLAYDVDCPLQIMALFPLVTLSTILPITISGIGIRESVAVILLSHYNIPEAVAFNAFFMHFIIANIIPGLLGLFFIPEKSEAH
jgi:glycosyltransferase 2 family protein